MNKRVVAVLLAGVMAVSTPARIELPKTRIYLFMILGKFGQIAILCLCSTHRILHGQ